MEIAPFKLERFFAKHEFSSKYLLCSSDCESMSQAELLDLEPESRAKLEKLWLGYTESKGNPELRKEIAKLYSNITPEETLVFSGAEEAIFLFMNAILKKGDNVIIQTPCYQSLTELPKTIGCEITEWNCNEEENWKPSLEILKAGIKENTKAIIINSPHNPTGYTFSEQEIREIISIAKDKDIYIFSDEVYKGLEYDPTTKTSSACDVYEKALSLGVMSKTFGLAGLRIGWLATKNKEILEKIASLRDYTTICNSAPSEFLAIIALKNKEKIIKRNLDIIQNNLKLLDEFFKDYSNWFEWIKPKAGTLALVKLKNNKEAMKFCEDLIEKKGVLLMPTTMYDLDNQHFRIGFGRKNMPESLNELKSYLQENPEIN